MDLNSKKYSPSKVSFYNPLKGRQWLKILEPSLELGLNLVPNLDINNRDTLGFSFKTNKIGFHGTCCTKADNVILGTSFAMGFGVDEGCNWFQLDGTFSDNYLNLGIPVSPGNHEEALLKFYEGKYKELIYVYHPNTWKTAAAFYKSKEQGKNIFEYLRWETDALSMFKLYPRWLMKRLYFKFQKTELFYKSKGDTYMVNVNYNRYKPDAPEYGKAIVDLIRIFSKFERVLVYRVPIKEQILKNVLNDVHLDSLCENYDECWHNFVRNNEVNTDKILFVDLCDQSVFELEDYLPNDTHWSPSGNIKFFNIVKQNAS